MTVQAFPTYPDIDGLPDKLSALIRVAEADLTKIEHDDRYCVSMDDDWHTAVMPLVSLGNSMRKCHVCLAGAVMCRRLGITQDGTPDDFPKRTQDKLYALDYIRAGDPLLAVAYARGCSVPELGTELENQLYELYFALCSPGFLPFYENDPEDFHEYLLTVADRLEALGE